MKSNKIIPIFQFFNLKFKLLFITFLFLINNSLAQISAEDSIYLSVSNLPETTQVDKLNEIAGLIKVHSILSSIKISEKSIQIAKTYGYTKGLIDAFNNAGLNNYNIGNQQKAFEYYINACKLSTYTNYTNGIIISSNNLAMFYSESADFAKAIQYYNIALYEAKKSKQLHKVASLLNNIGNMYLNQDSLSKALEQYEIVLKIREENKDNEGLANVLNNIGNVYQGMKEYAKAQTYFKQASNYYLKTENQHGLSISYFNIGKIYEMMNQKELAIVFYRKSLYIAEKLEIKNVLIFNYAALSDYYTQTKDYYKALTYEKMRNNLKEKVFNEETQKQISEIQAKFDFENKEKEIQLLNKEKKIQNLELTKQRERNNLQIIIILAFVILSVGLFYFYLSKRKLKEKAMIEKAMAEQQKQIFSAIINAEENERNRFAKDLHDEIGPLLSSSKMYIDMIISDKFDAVQKNEMLLQTKTIIKEAVISTQEIAHQLMPSALDDFGIVGALNVYFDRLKIENLISLHFLENIKNKRLDKNIEITIYRVIKELINNTLKYANAKNITLEIIQNENKLTINYLDDGKGFDIKSNQKEYTQLGGMGLNNIKSRINYINGKYKLFSEINKGFSILIEIDL